MTNLTSLKRRRRNLGKTIQRMKADHHDRQYSFQTKVREAKALTEKIRLAMEKYNRRPGKK